MKKWKVPDIVAREDGCVPHSLSIMRLALGYKTGLPEGTKVKETTLLEDIPELARACFPDRHLMVMKTNAEGCYSGDWWDNYLMAFCYRNPDDDTGHMVIGSPMTHKEQALDLVVAVSIDRKW